MCRKPIFLISLVLLLVLINSASAKDYRWKNYGGDRQWCNPYNWNPGGIPGPNDTAEINPPPYYGPIIDCDVHVDEIHGPTYDSVNNQVMDIIGGTVVVDDDWRWARFNVGMATVNITGSPDITIGDNWLGEVSGGTAITNISCCPNITIGGRWRDADKGTAIVNIDGDPTITAKERIRFGDENTATATITMTGGLIEDWGQFKFGDDGDVTFNMSGGTFLIGVGAGYGRDWVFEARNGGINTANISGTAYIYVENNILVGASNTSPGVATINMSGGTITDNNDMLVPAAPNALGILNMTGGNVNVNGHLEIGGWGTGKVFLYGGTIKTHTFGMRTSGGIGTMRICCDGMLIVDDPTGSVKATIDGYVANGWITCKDLGCPPPSVVWNGVDTTTVSCQPKKWSQPPIEIDPNVNVPPVYCGWDQNSFTEDPCGPWQVVADDFRCLGTMPITSVQWWGSYLDWNQPEVQPPQLPIAWRFGFWSNVPAGLDPNFSYPKELLRQIEVDADRVDVNEVGMDAHPNYPNDVCYRYYVDFKPDEIFWQDQFLADTNDDIFWLSIAAIYDPCEGDPNYPWGWKTRPWSWMDDAVTFSVNTNPQPGITLDPCSNQITPIEYLSESYDVAFELDTDLSWIKCHQPFTGSRDWPHYEGELSMIVGGLIHHTKWVQAPDLSDFIPPTPTGMDVLAGPRIVTSPPSPFTWHEKFLADDFECTQSGRITKINIWGSYLRNVSLTSRPPFFSVVPRFSLVIYENVPAGGGLPSRPGRVLWDAYRQPSAKCEYWEVFEDFYDPNPDETIGWDSKVWWFSFAFGRYEAFIQEEGKIYWLGVHHSFDLDGNGMVDSSDLYLLYQFWPDGAFGWKVSWDHFEDNAVWTDVWTAGTNGHVAPEPSPPSQWNELRYPSGHPFDGNSIDLAFEIGTEKVQVGPEEQAVEELVTRRLVADDWPCDQNTPITAAVWWGSYIGYGYAACQDQQMARPVKPDYFRLTIWDDVPAGAEIAKWSQLPDMNTGTAQYSVHLGDAVCSSDFNCTDPDPVVAVRWWGSYLDGTDPGDGPNCKPFELVFHYDVPVDINDPETGEDLDYSHPTYPWLYYEHVTAEERYYGTTAGGEKVYEYIAWLPEPFDQEYWKNHPNNPDPCSGIFWLDIGYVDEANYYPPDVNWGWHESVDNRIDLSISNPSWHFGPWADVNVLDKDLAFEIITGEEPHSHPKDIIWDYNAYAYDEVLVGYDKHPEDPNDIIGREPVFRYSVRLPHEAWFCQGEPNDVYWFSVAAVYDQNTPNYDWGWTNHEHVYNDNAVAGVLNSCDDEPKWLWQELYDQTELNSVDMSFILFTEPECFPKSDPAVYQIWVDVGRPGSWCCKYHGQGDANGDGLVNIFDLWIFKSAYNAIWPQPKYNPDADFHPDGAISLFDLWIFKPNYNSNLGAPYDCPYDDRPYPCP